MTAIDARYGRTPRRRLRARVLAVVAGAAVVVVMAAWVVWAGVFGPGATVETQDVGFEVRSDAEVLVRGEVSVAPGTAVRCAVAAEDEKQAFVGWRVVELPPSEDRTRHLSETVRTTRLADVGLIYRCWLT